MIRCENLGVALNGEQIVEDISLVAAEGEITALVGPNGSGKSTLLRTLAGLLRPQAGSIEASRPVAFMPQDSTSAPPLTVRQAVLLGRVERLGLRVGADDYAAADYWIAKLDLSAIAPRRLDQISGGQRQLAYIAQTLMRGPRVLLLDEPTSALDIGNQLDILEIIRAVTRSERLTTIVAIHDLAMAARISDQIVALKLGRVTACGRPCDVLTRTFFAMTYGIDADIDFSCGPHPVLRVHGRLSEDCAHHAFSGSPSRA
jgi:iron complex transport system ATP-binding protein